PRRLDDPRRMAGGRARTLPRPLLVRRGADPPRPADGRCLKPSRWRCDSTRPSPPPGAASSPEQAKQVTLFPSNPAAQSADTFGSAQRFRARGDDAVTLTWPRMQPSSALRVLREQRDTAERLRVATLLSLALHGVPLLSFAGGGQGFLPFEALRRELPIEVELAPSSV